MSIAGAATIAVLAVAAPAEWSAQVLLLAALVMVGELLPIDVPRRQGLDRITTSTAFAFAIALLFGPLPAVVAYAGASLIADGIARLGWLKIVFNAAQYALALTAAAGTMLVLGAQLPLASLATELPRVAAGALAFLAVNHLLAGTAAALLARERVGVYLLSDLPFQLLTACGVLALTPVVVACAEVSIALVPLCLLPILAIYVGARQAARDAHRAVHDALTTLPNRVLLRERLERQLQRPGASLVLMIVDLDDFKAVNDTLGHAYGDRLLQEVARRLRDALGPRDTLARLGGDEFAVLLIGPGDVAAGRQVAEQLVAALDAPFELDDILLHVRASVGLACHPAHGDDPEELLRRADIALYCAKSSEQPVEVYAAADDHYSVDRLMLAGQLRRGIRSGEILLEYQPKYPLAGGRPTGVEALARWQHPDLGRVGPDGFVPLAEQAGLMGELTDVVLRDAIAQCRRWRDQGLDLRVSVNLSPAASPTATCRGGSARCSLRTTSRPPSLQLEITESRSLPGGRGATRVADELRAMGVSIAIDDFGTGFSSLVQLQRLPVDEIKIDRSFVATMAHSASDAAIVRSTIDLARNLGLRVTAEGVESDRARAQLTLMGCELAQGYSLCPPVSADRCARVVRECPEPESDETRLSLVEHVA